MSFYFWLYILSAGSTTHITSAQALLRTHTHTGWKENMYTLPDTHID